MSVLLLQDHRNGLQKILNFEFADALERNTRFQQHIGPPGEVAAALLPDEADVLLPAADLPAGSDAVVQQQLQLRLRRVQLVHQLEIDAHERF